MLQTDFRVIAPSRTNPKTALSEGFIVPCTVLEIASNDEGKRIKIVISRLDFQTGKLITHAAIMWRKTLETFKELDMTLPMRTDCEVVKDQWTGKLDFRVYRWSDVCLFNA